MTTDSRPDLPAHPQPAEVDDRGPAADPVVVHSRARRIAFVGAGSVLAVQGLCLLWLPLRGDQSLVALISRDVAAGRHLYTEIFEGKQPGLYLLYGGVGKVFGTAQPVAQAVSVFAMVATAGLLVRLLSRRLRPGWVRYWLPLLVAAPLLLSLAVFDLGQSELLMCLPVTAAMLLAAGPAGGRTSARRAVLAGACIGVVAMFKAVIVAVPLVAVAILLLMLGGRRRWWYLLAAGGGALLVPLGVVAWLAVRGDLLAALEAWFVYPTQFLGHADARPLDRLVAAVRRFAVLLAPAIVLAIVRLPTVWRRREPLDVALVGWLIAGLGIYVIQVWWSYYLVILVPALAALAVRQLDDEMAGERRWRRRTVLLVTAALSVPLLAYGLLGAGRTIADGGGLTAASRERIAERVGDYTTIHIEIAASGLASGESLYVLGDPRYQLLAERPIALVTNGWSAALMPPQRWSLLADELRRIRPTMLFVDQESAVAVARRGALMGEAMNDLYVVVRVSDLGTWYRYEVTAQ